MSLAIRTGIAPSVWRDQDPADIVTACYLLEVQHNEGK